MPWWGGGGCQSLDRAGTVTIDDRCRQSDELFELPGSRAGLFLGRTPSEDALAGGGVGGDHAETRLSGRGGIDAGAVLEPSSAVARVRGELLNTARAGID